MASTVSETSSGLLLADTATSPTPTSSNTTPVNPSTDTPKSGTSASASATHTPSSAPLSTGSIVGIAVGSIAALVLLISFLLFAFGFRIRRAKWRGDPNSTEEPKLSDNKGAAAGGPTPHHGKAELEDAEYTRRLERLHDGGKPELEGDRPRKSGWGAFSIKSMTKRGSRPAPAELDTRPMTSGPHELPGDSPFQAGSEKLRDLWRAA
ncbi:hypothetical protein J7T55_010626 [Diaporthe amygdali]|uniref:uncharacterized protein n=1 Tax=Phomopsis amygdali TaxID=1214568 RepID=UPI0022FEFA1E|nr:uncharacterized protein J7T55_010626 [Diaporthe amygdali]KAJ0114239.1 hypothetical protein J7T55_010626 [Diaporthe amygdali]